MFEKYQEKSKKDNKLNGFFKDMNAINELADNKDAFKNLFFSKGLPSQSNGNSKDLDPRKSVYASDNKSMIKPRIANSVMPAVTDKKSLFRRQPDNLIKNFKPVETDR